MTSTGPLAGITVLDLTTSLSGPLASGILADLGASVVKVERPAAPDRARTVGTRVGDISAMFHMANRGKRSIALDLQDPTDREVAVRLARTVDVVVENFRPGVTERLGMDYPTLSALNDGLVYVSINGFGSTGPYSRRPAFDSLLQAYGGIAALQGRAAADGTPELINHAVVDKVAGLIGAQGALAALLARERGAGGQHIDVSMLEVAAWFVYLDAAGSSTLLDAPRNLGDDATTGKRIAVQFSDGWGMLSLGHDASFAATCGVFQVDLPLTDLTTTAERDAHPEEYEAVLDVIRRKAERMTRADAGGQLLAAGAMFAEVLDPAEIPGNEQVVARDFFVESQHPVAGRIREPRLPGAFSKTPTAPPRPSPSLGEHTRAVKSEVQVESAHA